MNRIPLLAALLAASLLVGACGGADPSLSSSGEALTAEEAAVCSGQIAALSTATSAVIFKNPKDQAFALVKLSEAQEKLSLGKLVDAVQKLDDYELKITNLIAQGKIFPSADGLTTPESLVAGAQAAQACILPPPPVVL